MIRSKIFLLFFVVFSFCDLENRYPEAGEFCVPMRENPDCVKMDFRNKKLTIGDNTIDLAMVTRVQYEKYFEERKLEIDVLSEHRLQIRSIKFPEKTLEKEEIYIRKKAPRISIWTRIKNWRENNK